MGYGHLIDGFGISFLSMSGTSYENCDNSLGDGPNVNQQTVLPFPKLLSQL